MKIKPLVMIVSVRLVGWLVGWFELVRKAEKRLPFWKPDVVMTWSHLAFADVLQAPW